MNRQPVQQRGAFIDLPASISRIERWGKQLRHAFYWCGDAWFHQGRPPAIIAWPELPSRRTMLHKVCRHKHWELTNQARTRIIGAIRFEDTTEQNGFWPKKINIIETPVWNKGCIDIRKQTLEKAHQNIFGYGMAVNPLTQQGSLLIKSDSNAQHDGRIVQGPLTKSNIETGCVYQRVIDNRDENGQWLDLRLVYILGRTPLAYKKYKRASERFTNLTISATLAMTSDVFDSNELHSIDACMQLMGVDYAELDVLRHAEDGRIFIVDVNPTPWGPPAGLSPEEAQNAIELYAQSFQEAVDAK